MIYDHNPTGHCPGWLYLVARGFRETGAHVLVFCRTDDTRLNPWVGKMRAAGCEVAGIPASVGNHASHACDEAQKHQIPRMFFPNFDSIVYEMGKLRVADLFEGMDIGGIWLRPELHGKNPGWWTRVFLKFARTRAGKLERRRLRTLDNNRRGLQAFLPGRSRARDVRLFFTSPDSAAEMSSLLGKDHVGLICDPWIERPVADKSAARDALGLDQDRVVFLHTGTSRPAKGLKDACEAMLRMEPALLGRCCLLRAGMVDALDAPALGDLVDAGAALMLDRYVEEEELALCHAAADWVLLPYRGQKESSGVLIQAAVNGCPVIASDHGWIGTSVGAYRLGRLFPHGDVAALAGVLSEVTRTGEAAGWDSSGMEEFARLNSPEVFCATLNGKWLLGETDSREAS